MLFQWVSLLISASFKECLMGQTLGCWMQRSQNDTDFEGLNNFFLLLGKHESLSNQFHESISFWN